MAAQSEARNGRKQREVRDVSVLAWIMGALMAGWLFTSYGHPGVGGSIVIAYAGAVVFLWGRRVLTWSQARV